MTKVELEWELLGRCLSCLVLLISNTLSTYHASFILMRTLQGLLIMFSGDLVVFTVLHLIFGPDEDESGADLNANFVIFPITNHNAACKTALCPQTDQVEHCAHDDWSDTELPRCQRDPFAIRGFAFEFLKSIWDVVIVIIGVKGLQVVARWAYLYWNTSSVFTLVLLAALPTTSIFVTVSFAVLQMIERGISICTHLGIGWRESRPDASVPPIKSYQSKEILYETNTDNLPKTTNWRSTL